MPGRRILIRAAKDPFLAATAEDTMQRNLIATNTGNLLFSDSAFRMLSTEGTEVVANGPRLNGDPTDADRINEEFDAFVIPLANAFRPEFEKHLRTLTALVEKLTIPVTVLGVGAQTSLDYDLAPMRPLDASVRRFMRAVLDRSPSVGVRGEFTEHYLRDLGFSDVEVIGCPSMFLHGRDLAVRPVVGRLDEGARVAVSISNWVDGIGAIIESNYERYPGLTYFAQELRDLQLMYWGDLSRAGSLASDVPEMLSHPLFRDGAAQFHLAPSTWIDDLAGYDFSVGTRIHGNIAALLAGTPAFVMCHDSRTLELSRYFEIPHATVPSLDKDVDIADLLAAADYGPLVSGHEKRLDRMTDYLARHGLASVFSEGEDRGAAFDARIAETAFVGPQGVWDGRDDGSAGYRTSWLKDSAARQSQRTSVQGQKITALTRRVEALERSSEDAAHLREELAASQARIAALEKSLRAVEKVVSVPLSSRVKAGVSSRLRSLKPF